MFQMVTKGVSERVQVAKKTEIRTHVVGKFFTIIFKKNFSTYITLF